jgi:hypothetical protein
LKERESNKKKLNKEDPRRPQFSLEAKEAETPYGETLEWTKL